MPSLLIAWSCRLLMVMLLLVASPFGAWSQTTTRTTSHSSSLSASDEGSRTASLSAIQATASSSRSVSAPQSTSSLSASSVASASHSTTRSTSTALSRSLSISQHNVSSSQQASASTNVTHSALEVSQSMTASFSKDHRSLTVSASGGAMSLSLSATRSRHSRSATMSLTPSNASRTAAKTGSSTSSVTASHDATVSASRNVTSSRPSASLSASESGNRSKSTSRSANNQSDTKSASGSRTVTLSHTISGSGSPTRSAGNRSFTASASMSASHTLSKSAGNRSSTASASVSASHTPSQSAGNRSFTASASMSASHTLSKSAGNRSSTASASVSASHTPSQSAGNRSFTASASMSVSRTLSKSRSTSRSATSSASSSHLVTNSTTTSASHTVTHNPYRTPSNSHQPSASRSLSLSSSASSSLTKSQSASRSKSLTGTSSLTASTSETPSQTETTTWSMSVSSSASQGSKTASRTHSVSFSDAASASTTINTTGSVSETVNATASLTETRNTTVSRSVATSQRRSWTAGTATLSLTRSKLVDGATHSKLLWVQRPLGYAAPGVAFSLQPIVAIDVPFNAQFAPKFCTLSSPLDGVVLMGPVITRVVRGLCIFANTGILRFTGPIGDLSEQGHVSVPLVVYLNTSGTRFPRLQPSTNTTRVTLATCDALYAPLGSQSVYALNPPRASWNGSATVLDTVVSGYFFTYESRYRTRCHLNLTTPAMPGGNATSSYAMVDTSALFLDMCHVRCVFATSTVSDPARFAAAMASGPMRGRLHMSVNGIALDSDCAGTNASFLSGPHNLCRATGAGSRLDDGCTVHFVGPNASVLFSPSSGQPDVPFVASASKFTLPAVAAYLCDAANNTMLVDDTMRSLTMPTVAPVAPSVAAGGCASLVTTLPPVPMLGVPSVSAAYGSHCTSIVTPINRTDGACGPANDTQPIRFQLLGVPPIAPAVGGGSAPNASLLPPYCVRNSQVNGSFVMTVEISNEASILPTADDQTTLPVPLQLVFRNWLGDPIVLPLDPLRGSSLFPLAVRTLRASPNASLAWVVVATTYLNVSLSQVPVTLDTIRIPFAGTGYGLEVVGLRDAEPRAMLWGTDFPRQKNLTVFNCSNVANTFGIVASYYTVGAHTSCGANISANTVVLTDRIPLRDVYNTSVMVTVRGWRFDYAFSDNTRCHYSTLEDPWTSSTGGTPATYVSSCELRCAIPPQQRAIRQSSSLYVADNNGTTRSKNNPPPSVSSSAMANLGSLRIQYGMLSSWSNPLSVDIVGTAHAVDAGTSWASVQNTFQSKEITRLTPTLQAQVVDAVGGPLMSLDEVVRMVRISVDNASAADLNASRVVSASGWTCDPSPGVALFDLVFESPAPGTYSLSLGSPQLAGGTVQVFIVPYTNVSNFLLATQTPPYAFNTQTLENPLGTLPQQPVVVALHPMTRTIDTSVSDVSCIATFVPVNATTPITTGVNLDDTVCNPAFGNCAVLSNGVARFTKLSFVGVPGAMYTLTIRLRNESRTEDSGALKFNITAAVCSNLPSNLGTMTARLIGPLNASLAGPETGFLIKGWKFDPAVGLSCYFNGTELPATIVDYCTARCLIVDPAANSSAPTATGPGNNGTEHNCFVGADGRHVTCLYATGGPLHVCNGSCTSANLLVPVDGGNVTFVGRAQRISAVPNVQSPRTLSNGNQAVVANQSVLLDALVVTVVDARGEFVANVDPQSDNMVVELAPTIAIVPNMLRVPHLYEGSFNDAINSTCFSNSSITSATPTTAVLAPPMRFSANSSLQCRVQKGLCVFDRLFLEYPRVGQYQLTATASDLTGSASFVLHIVAGTPHRLCIYTNMTGADAYIQQNALLLHPPKLLALDDSGNVFQLGSLDPMLGALPYVTLAQGTAPSAVIRARVWRRIDGVDAQYTLLPYLLPEAALLQPDYTMQYGTLTLNATYGASFIPEFFVESQQPALQSVFAPPLRLMECTVGQFAYWGRQSCETCLSGPTACDGLQTNCFICNGSSYLNVTEGFWRYSSRSYHAYVCPLDSCMGNTELGACTQGYLDHAPLCAVCDVGYAADFLGSCVRCSGVAVTAALFVLACITAIVVVAIIVFVTVTEQEDDDNSLVLLLKICVNFIQTSGTIGQFAMNVPDTVKQFLGVQNSISGGGGISISPFNCLAPDFTYMTKYRIQMLGPPVALFLVALVVKAVTRRLKTDFRNLYNLVVMVFLFLVYQTLVSQSVGAMYCQPILGEESALVMSVLRDDVRVNCLDGQYQWDFAIVLYALAIYGLGIPVVALVVIMVTSAKLGWESSYVRYSFLISGYRLRYWYWEIIILARKIGLLLLVAMTDNATLQALLGIWLLTASLVVTIRYQPFVKGVLNQAESLALLVQLITVNVGLFFRTVSTSQTCGVLCIIVSCILLILNAGVFVFFGRHLLLEGYFRVLGTFGLDVVHSDNRRYVSIRNIKKTVLMQLRYTSGKDFATYTPNHLSHEVSVSSPRRKDMVTFADDDDGNEQVELLTLRRIAVTPQQICSAPSDVHSNGPRRKSRMSHGTRLRGDGSMASQPSRSGPLAGDGSASVHVPSTGSGVPPPTDPSVQ